MSTKEPFTLPHGVRSYRAVEDLGERTPAGVYAASSLASLVGSPVIDETGKAYESSTIVDAQGNGTNVTATVRLPSRAVGETLGLDDQTLHPRLAPECSGECYRAARLGPGCNGVCQRAYPDYEGPCSPLPRPAIVDVVAAVETPHRPAPFAVDTKEATLARDAVRQHRHGGHALADAWRAALTGALAATRTGTPTDRARDAMAVADAVVLELMEATP